MDKIKLNQLDNSAKIMYVLNEFENLTFTDIIKETNLSRNTVSKYLTQLKREENIKKIIIQDESDRERMAYTLTEQGRHMISDQVDYNQFDWFISLSKRSEALDFLRTKDLIGQNPYSKQKEYLGQIEDSFFNLLNNSLNILEFGGEELGRINEIIAQIGRFASYFGEEFFKRPPSLYLHLAVVFIFFNSIENPQYHINEDYYLTLYGQSIDYFKEKYDKLNEYKDQIKHYIKDFTLLTEIELIFGKQADNILTGAYDSVPYSDALNILELELHEQILLKSKNQKTEFSDRKNLMKKYRKIYIEYYKAKKKLIREFDNQLISIINGNYGLYNLIFNYEPYYFHELDSVGAFLNRRLNDALTEELINKRIFGIKEVSPLIEIADQITDEMETMHIIWEEIKEKFRDVVLNLLFQKSEDFGLRKSMNEKMSFSLSDLKGFCPTCGRRILVDSEECEFCKTSFSNKDLIFDVKLAKKISNQYKAVQYIETPSYDVNLFYKCKCGQLVGRSWNRCSRCKQKLK